jgi:hypothetical protein
VDSSLAKFYGMPPLTLPRGKDGNLKNQFLRLELDGEKRGGLLTHGTFMAGLANANQTSPVRRGQFVRERLLCEHLPPPPPNAMVELPPLDPKLTTRERFDDHALDVGCAGCHKLMDPIGLGFENFDGNGLWRDTEADKPLDASGEINGWGDGAFTGAVGLARKLAASDQVKACLARRWFEYAYGREIDARSSDACSLDIVRRRFAAGGDKIKDLVGALAETDDSWQGRLNALAVTLVCFSVAALSVELLFPYPWIFAIALALASFCLTMLGALGERYGAIASATLILSV